MKKLVLMAAAIVAVSFASCGNKAANADATATDSIAVVETETVESTCCGQDSTATCCQDSAAVATEAAAE